MRRLATGRHSEIEFECAECGRTFHDRALLEKHEQRCQGSDDREEDDE